MATMLARLPIDSHSLVELKRRRYEAAFTAYGQVEDEPLKCQAYYAQAKARHREARKAAKAADRRVKDPLATAGDITKQLAAQEELQKAAASFKQTSQDYKAARRTAKRAARALKHARSMLLAARAKAQRTTTASSGRN